MMLAALMLLAADAGQDNCNDPIAQQEMNRCAARDYAVADAELNVQWKKALAAARERDKADPVDKTSPAMLGYADALIAAQRAWIAYRDAECRAEAQEMRGGSAEPMIFHGCRATLTRDRTAQLHDNSEAQR